MSIKVTMLVDNSVAGRDERPAPMPDDVHTNTTTARPASPEQTPDHGQDAEHGLASEHGLSVWIECDGLHVLLDTGQGPALEANAPALDIDLGQTDALVLSHGHYDHTGGMPYALEHAKHASVYCHPAALQERYSAADEPRPIGMPDASQKALRALPAGAAKWVLGPTMLSDRVGITGPIPRLTDYEDTGGPFYLDPAGWRPDPLEDDMAVWIRTDDGLVVCLGCAHSGVINTVDWISRLDPEEKVHAVIGGMHLMNADERRLVKTAKALAASEASLFIPCHCTGSEASKTLGQYLGDRMGSGGAGLVLEF